MDWIVLIWFSFKKHLQFANLFPTFITVLRVQVKYPDQQKCLIIPPATDLKQLSVLRYRLVTKIVLSHVLWSGKCSRLYSKHGAEITERHWYTDGFRSQLEMLQGNLMSEFQLPCCVPIVLYTNLDVQYDKLATVVSHMLKTFYYWHIFVIVYGKLHNCTFFTCTVS